MLCMGIAYCSVHIAIPEGILPKRAPNQIMPCQYVQPWQVHQHFPLLQVLHTGRQATSYSVVALSFSKRLIV